MPGIDYSKRYRDYARFTPAVSEMYVRYVFTKDPKRQLPISQTDMDFLDPESNLFHLPCSLYSAGQGVEGKDTGKRIARRKNMVTERDKGITTIIGDSGGFQIQTGAIKFRGDETRRKMMEWLEKNCDWSMILDFPTGGIGIGNIDEHLRRLESDINPLIVDSGNVEAINALIRKNGGDINDREVRLYYACMLQTMINNDWFVKHRTPGATKFLNVVQGRNESESKTWYENVKHYPFEGWSLASHHKENFEMTLGRIINMRDDGLLKDRDWMHFLGVGKFQHGCAYTTIQRAIRDQINPNFTISYDVSSPFTLAAFGKVFLGYNLNKDSWSIQGEKLDGQQYLSTNAYEDKEGKRCLGYHQDLQRQPILDQYGNKITLPSRGTEADRPFLDVVRELYDERMKNVKGGTFVETEIGKHLKMGDVCVIADPSYTSTWDFATYAILMNHNVQVHLEGVFESQDLYDKGDPERVPLQLLQLKDVIEKVFKSETPMDVIDKNRKILTFLASDNASRGVLIKRDFEEPPQKDHILRVKAGRESMAPKPVKYQEVNDLFEF